MQCDACLQTRLGSNRQTISQTREHKIKNPKTEAKRKKKWQKVERERDRKIDKVRICFACANHVADKARLATFKYICMYYTYLHISMSI